jgi:hypothetical protein
MPNFYGGYSLWNTAKGSLPKQHYPNIITRGLVRSFLGYLGLEIITRKGFLLPHCSAFVHF